MILTHGIQVFYDSLLTLAYPQACAICARSVEQRKFGVVCEACWQQARVFTADETICWKCGLPAPAEIALEFREQVRCLRCDSEPFTAARAVGFYEGALHDAVLMLKRQPHLPAYVENLLVAVAMREPLTASTVIMPVPLHPKRLRSRGFNQAAVIAEALSKRLRLPLDEVSLVRVSTTDKYRAGLDAKGRRDTVAGAFAVRHTRLVAREDILLVDDVFTTGATVSACAEALIGVGASSVYVLTVARAGKGQIATYF